MSSPEFSHLDESGRARMVDVSAKDVTRRRAVGSGRVRMQPATLAAIQSGGVSKGDVLAVAQIAGVQAAKQNASLIPLCHPLPLEHVELSFESDGEDTLVIRAEVIVTAKTGAEMEALTAVSVAALTVYDMCKAADRGMVIENIRLESKSGGKSGDYTRE